MKNYCRPVAISPNQIRPGDLVDISDTDQPSWLEVTGRITCNDDPEANNRCDYDGGCDLVLTLHPVFESDPQVWHLTHDEEIDVRLAAVED